MNNELKPLWNKYLQFDWKFGLFLLLLVSVPRFILVLKANQTGNYSAIGLIMAFSALVPFIFLSKDGRRNIGIRKTNKILFLILAFVTGIVANDILYVLGKFFYGNTYENWFMYIGKSYNIPTNVSPDHKRTLFFIMAITGMTFSPIGEEFFFRGIVHGSFAKSLGEKKASVIDSLAFAFVHISHFGLVFISGQWHFYFVPCLIWVASMFLVSYLFIYMKKLTKSLWGAVICHAAFNLGMIYCIFYMM